MFETIAERMRRQAQALHADVQSVLASTAQSDEGLRAELERIAQKPQFQAFTWLWGPRLAERNRVLFRPFILSHFGRWALDARGEVFDPWAGAGSALRRWLRAVDDTDDVELTRRLYEWQLEHVGHGKRLGVWRSDVVRRLSEARSPAARVVALSKVDLSWMSLDAPTAVALYALDAPAARPFILKHLPSFHWSGESREPWSDLLDETRTRDPEFHFEIYRRVVTEKRWRSDVAELCTRVSDPQALDHELEVRHPVGPMPEVAEIFHQLLRARG